MGDLCRLFSRSTKFNIAIYIIAVFFVCIFGGFWIYGKQRDSADEQKAWQDKAYITAVVGLITVSGLISANMILYELTFNEKCNRLEKFIERQATQLKARLDPVNLSEQLTSNVSRAVAKTITSSFSDKLKSALTQQLSDEFPGMKDLIGSLTAAPPR